jgi:hypothetical protein
LSNFGSTDWSFGADFRRILWPEAVVFLILQGYIFVHTVAMGLGEPVDRIGMGTTTECARFFAHSG